MPSFQTGSEVQQAFEPASGNIQLITASGAISPHNAASYIITKSSAPAVMTLAAPTSGVDDGKEITITSDTTQAHTVTATGLFGTGSSAVNEATFAAYLGAGFKIKAYQGNWLVLSAVGITWS